MDKKYNKNMPLVWVAVLLFALPMALMGQKLKYADENTQKEYMEILYWQTIKAKYDALAAECDSLKIVVEKLKSDETGLVLATIYPNAKIMYDQCDVEILKRHKGMLGNPDKEQQLAALLVCHQAEQALAKRYDEKTVKNARESLKNPQVVVKEVANDIDKRLRYYEDKTMNLKKALKDAADTLINKIPKGALSVKTKEMIVKKFFFDELEKSLDPDLLNPERYPFLHQKLMESAQSIMVLKDDKIKTGENLKQIVNQTITKIINEL